MKISSVFEGFSQNCLVFSQSFHWIFLKTLEFSGFSAKPLGWSEVFSESPKFVRRFLWNPIGLSQGFTKTLEGQSNWLLKVNHKGFAKKHVKPTGVSQKLRKTYRDFENPVKTLDICETLWAP